MQLAEQLDDLLLARCIVFQLFADQFMDLLDAALAIVEAASRGLLDQLLAQKASAVSPKAR